MAVGRTTFRWARKAGVLVAGGRRWATWCSAASALGWPAPVRPAADPRCRPATCPSSSPTPSGLQIYTCAQQRSGPTPGRSAAPARRPHRRGRPADHRPLRADPPGGRSTGAPWWATRVNGVPAPVAERHPLAPPPGHVHHARRPGTSLTPDHLHPAHQHHRRRGPRHRLRRRPRRRHDRRRLHRRLLVLQRRFLKSSVPLRNKTPGRNTVAPPWCDFFRVRMARLDGALRPRRPFRHPQRRGPSRPGARPSV